MTSQITGRTTIVSLAFVVSIALIIWLASTVARLENVHYGVLAGKCLDTVRGQDFEDPYTRLEYVLCLEETPTRTFGIWHIAHALGIL